MSSTGRVVVDEIVRPAAVVPEDATRLIMMQLAMQDVRAGGTWQSSPNVWARFDKPWQGGEQADARKLGSIEIAYGTPSRYEVTIYRVSITDFGEDEGWTVRRLVDEALGHAGLTLDDCPRSRLAPPPPPVRF